MQSKAFSSDKNMPKADLRAWIVCLAAGLFFFYEFIQMNMLSSLNADLMRVYNIQATDLGLLSSFYFLANVIFLLPAGQLLDRFSTRKIILVSMSICVLGTFLFALSTSLVWASIFRFLTGIGSAFCFLSCVRLASRWFPSSHLALINGFIVTMAMLGGWIAQAPFTWVVGSFGWRNALFLDTVLGLIITGLIFITVEDYPRGYQRAININSLSYWKSLAGAYLKKQNWLAGLYTCLMNLPVFLMGATWGSLYLEQVDQFSRAQATDITGMIFLGTVIGSPLSGWFSDKIGQRKLPMIAGALLSLCLIMWIILGHNQSLTLLLVAFFLLGLITSFQVLSYTVVVESSPPEITAMSVSVVSLTTISGGVFFIPLFGKLMDSHWSHQIIQGIPIYAASDYYHAMLIMPIAFIVALVAASFLKDKKAVTTD